MTVQGIWSRIWLSKPSCPKGAKAQNNRKRTARTIVSECQISAKKNTAEQALKGSLARQQDLKKLGITQEFNYSEPHRIYNYADHVQTALIETVDASIPATEITEYPELPLLPSPTPDSSKPIDDESRKRPQNYQSQANSARRIHARTMQQSTLRNYKTVIYSSSGTVCRIFSKRYFKILDVKVPL